MRIAVWMGVIAIFVGQIWAQPDPVKAAYMYCSWPNGQASFRDEFDAAFQALGWNITKFENTQAAELSARLEEFDIVIGGSVSNLDNAQDFAPYATQWQDFLRRGGVVIATDASYGGINSLWIGALDPALKTASAICSAHSRPAPETQTVKFALDDPLLNFPHFLPAELAAKNHWAHLENVGEGWRTSVTCFDGKPLLIYRAYGKGLVVVTNYFRFMGSSSSAGAHLLANALTLSRLQQRGLCLQSLLWPTQMTLGENAIHIRAINISGEAMSLGWRLEARKENGVPILSEQKTMLKPAEETEITLRFNLPERGKYTGTIEIWRNNETWLNIQRAFVVPELISLSLAWRHYYQHRRPEAEATIKLAPELQARLSQLRIKIKVVDAQSRSEQTFRPVALEFMNVVSLARLLPGQHELSASLFEGETKIAEAKMPFSIHPRPRVYYNEHNVCFVEGKPFFPLGMYHVAWRATKEEMLQCVEDLAQAGFNTIHTSCTNLDTFQEVLDRAYALGMKVIPEGIRPGSAALHRFKKHPAILAWNSGDEPDCHNVGPEDVREIIDAVRDTDPEHPLYTTVAHPDMLMKYAPYVDILSHDPYPIAHGNKNTIAVARQTARAREAVRQRKPLWIVPQCFGYKEGPWDVPTPAQERSMTYQALIEGANGLIWYTYDDKNFRVREHPELWEMMKRLVQEIKTIEPFLLAPSYTAERFQAGPEGCIRGCKIKNGSRWLIMAAHTNDADLGIQELPVPGLPTRSKLEVLFENRRLAITAGKLQDVFGPYDVHLYLLNR